ncbi:Na+/H+ antiporter [Nocardia neocaledoniensis NBRC 108232]|uniref:Sodium/proton antiporter (CPA1 family) n=1 Tax=Nocardia neocaledoniensis TaxID=236511 RepID=A0A317N2B5_9NOCA|nr:Na+/H+ antiporter [Nocardia neocaledoniensis]PWV67659.1 sodium/proton antiporter (CPA1 family) [Nocardia neocaledoniensis]GEM35239.1 Na+/H+ antiporter [Nocardia neocaledoniensis NBRC 108232]
MDQLVLTLVILLAAVLAESLGGRIGVAPSILMTVFGCLLALIPAVPSLNVPPELILPLVLPPLLYAAARRTSWRQFAENWQIIALRAVGLVIVTAVAVAAVFHAWNPATAVAAGLVLGALVAPPDPVAATSMASRLGLPRRLIVTLGGEGLFNDVTAIVIYTVGIQAVVTGLFSPWHALGDFVLAAVVGLVVGLALGWLGSRLTGYLDNATGQVALSLLLPFVAYGVAEHWEGSAVLAVLVCALYLTDAVTEIGDREYRLVADAFWDIAEMLITGFAFALIGLELRVVIETTGHDWSGLAGVTVAVLAVVVLLRLAWLLATWVISRKLGRLTDEPFTWREVIVTWWAGMRGVATVALALAVPFTIESGADFPARSQILFVAFAVVLFTLLVQGPTLPLVVRITGVHADTKRERALEKELWIRVRRAELAELQRIADTEDLPPDVYDNLRDRMRQVSAKADPEAADADAKAAMENERKFAARMRAAREAVVEAGRREALAARREPGMPPDVVDRVTRRLDLGPMR